MKLPLALFTALIAICSSGLAATQLEDEFRDPPRPARPWVYWINMDGHFTRAGITADLEAMKQAGIGGMIHMDVDVGVPRGEVPFMSETWQENFRHTVLECERLGLEFTTITGPGWTGTGGPWVEAENSMQHLVPASVDTSRPATFNQVLPKPQPQVSSYHRKQTPEMREALAAFYEDVAVYAFPRCEPVIADIDEKALFIRNPYTSMKGVRTHLPSPATWPEPDKSEVIDPAKIIDLTERLHPDGRLEWDVPPGEWTILRMGRRSTGANTRPAPAAGLGFESNKFDPRALDAHFAAYFDPLLKRIGPRPKDRTTGFTGLDADSWEMSSQNWTPGFREEFKKRRGYDPWPYFPAYSGRLVGSREITERFLWDLRTVCQELVFDKHISHLKALCHERGLKLAIEPYDMNPSNDLDLGSFADIPMGEFWRNLFNSAWSCIEAASIGHVMGRPIVAAEAFTAVQTNWKESPWTLKDQGDWALATGINRFVIVTFAHQPWLDRKPGMMFAQYGLHWERTQTFWPMVDEYHRYLARCSHLLQQGVTVSDILYLTPEGVPHVFRPPASAQVAAESRLPDKKGYGFDGCSPRILMNRAEVKDGMICFPGGTSYRVMVLPEHETMTPELLEKIIALVEAGFTVVGSPPVKSPGLAGYPECDGQVRQLAGKLWGSPERPKEWTQRRYGRGTIHFGGAPSGELYPDYAVTASVLKQMGVSEDFSSSGPVRYGHRRTEDREIYFLSNKSAESIEAACTFRVGEGRPELWDPVTGTTRLLPRYAQAKGRTTIPMRFAAHQSFFVVFARRSAAEEGTKENFPSASPVTTLEGSWQVSFDPEWGGPAETTFKELIDWSTSANDGIKHYSGIATYRKPFELSQEPNQQLSLDLGTVHEIARVRLNGRDLGVVWCAPWQVDISEAVREGTNTLEIEVANLWPNRLIGDAGKPEAERLTWTIVGHPYQADSELLPSGLLGPADPDQRPMKTSKHKTTAALAAIALFLAVVPFPAAAGAGSDERPPNILLILVDDVGYCDVGAFAARLRETSTDRIFYETPQIDRLAAEGTMFTQFYACTVCAPSRASLLTGRMNNRMGMWDAYAAVKTTFEKTGKPVPPGCHILDHEPWDEYRYSKTDRGISVPVASTALHDVKTIPQGLDGYHSVFTAKWHLGSHHHAGHRPADQGFDQTLAYFDGGGSGYHRPFRAYAARTPKWDNPGAKLDPEPDYLCDDVARRVNRFLEDRAARPTGEPFFLYLAHPAAHTPIQSRDDDETHFKEKTKTPDLLGHKDPAYAGLIKGMDRSVGEILDKLDELKLSQNTAVIFLSDNGGHPKFTRNTPLRGGKSMLYEGGIRVPMIVRWPGRTTPGSVCDVPCDIADLYPTTMEIAGVDYGDFKADETTDGESLAPLLGDVENKRRAYTRDEFYHFYGKIGYTGFHNFATWATLRRGNYKLHYDYQGKVELYNIAADISEKHDLVESQPKLAHDMLVQLTDWLQANCNNAYLPSPNPKFDPTGKLPYGPYVPLVQLKEALQGGH